MVSLHIFIPTIIVVYQSILLQTCGTLQLASSCEFVISLELDRHAFVPVGAVNFTNT